MAIEIGSEELNNQGQASFNGTPLRQIIFNGTTVFKQCNCACWHNFIEQLSYDQDNQRFTFRPSSILRVATECEYPTPVRFCGTVTHCAAFDVIYECAADGKTYKAHTDYLASGMNPWHLSESFDFTTTSNSAYTLINAPLVYAPAQSVEEIEYLPHDPWVSDAQAHINMTVSNDPFSGTVSYNVVESYSFNTTSHEVCCFYY